jgi:hypothetical protein
VTGVVDGDGFDGDASGGGVVVVFVAVIGGRGDVDCRADVVTVEVAD